MRRACDVRLGNCLSNDCFKLINNVLRYKLIHSQSIPIPHGKGNSLSFFHIFDKLLENWQSPQSRSSLKDVSSDVQLFLLESSAVDQGISGIKIRGAKTGKFSINDNLL